MNRKRLFDIAAKLRETEYRSLEEIAEKIDAIAESGGMDACEELLEVLRTA